MGPTLCCASGRFFHHALWLYFIDNNGALAALVNGSSSVEATDLIIGATWSRIAASRCLPWFDRVDSKANPVDGLSRGVWDGGWDLRHVTLDAAALAELGFSL